MSTRNPERPPPYDGAVDRITDLETTVIREGRLSSVTLLRRLRHDSKKNKIYRAFRELGRAVRTMVLLRYISQPSLRQHIGKATNMVESFNRFSKWLNFGNHGVIAENDPEEQEKAIKFNTLVADLVMFNTVIDMSTVINQLQAEGHLIHRADLASMSPYQQDNVRPTSKTTCGASAISPTI